jgi:hypothetical protein
MVLYHFSIPKQLKGDDVRWRARRCVRASTAGKRKPDRRANTVGPSILWADQDESPIHRPESTPNEPQTE